MTRRYLAGATVLVLLGTFSSGAVAAPRVAQSRPQPCSHGTCWVAVNVATLWVSPSYPRSVDAPALANPAHPGQWVAHMTVAQKRWLVGKLRRRQRTARRSS